MTDFENILMRLKNDLEDEAEYTYHLSGDNAEIHQCYTQMRSVIDRYMTQEPFTQRCHKATIRKRGRVIAVVVEAIFPEDSH